MFEVSESFLLEDVTDPVAVSVFANTDDCDLANDNFDNLNGEYEDSLEDTFNADDSYYDGNEYGDMTTYSEDTPEDLIDMDCADTLNMDVNEDIIVDNDLSDEDGELIDIVDGAC